MSSRRNSFRHEIVDLHKEIFRRNQQQINDSVLQYTPAFQGYETRYKEFVKSYQRRSNINQLSAALNQVQIAYIGDYHTFPQSQRSFLRLLKQVTASRPVGIALEFVQGRHQGHLNEYMEGALSERNFLEAIEYQDHWVFGGWTSFKPIFEFARENSFPMIAIDRKGRGATGKTLLKRDAYSARKISTFHKDHPEHLLMVLVGELHIAPCHLPEAVRELTTGNGTTAPKQLSIYQNCEDIYWQLAEKGHEHTTEVVRISSQEYCIINSTPIVCQQSFLNWLELDDESEPLDAPECNFRNYANLIASFFNLPVENSVDEVEIATVVDLSFLARLRKRGDFSPGDMEQIKKQILSSESYYIPSAKMVYLGNLSLNHASEEATHFLRHVCSRSLEPKHLVDAFYARALEEAVGFLGSKLLNHRRKCLHGPALERLRRNKTSGEFYREMARLVLKHQRMVEGRKVRNSNQIFECDAEMFNAITHIIGYQLGDRLYYGLVDGVLDKAEIRELFFDCFEEDGAAFSTYLYFFARTSHIEVPERL